MLSIPSHPCTVVLSVQSLNKKAIKNLLDTRRYVYTMINDGAFKVTIPLELLVTWDAASAPINAAMIADLFSHFGHIVNVPGVPKGQGVACATLMPRVAEGEGSLHELITAGRGSFQREIAGVTVTIQAKPSE